MPINLDNVTNIMLGNTPVEQIADSLGNVLWSGTHIDPSTEYFYVEDVSGSDNTLSITKSNDSAPTIEVFKSTDQQNWSSMGSTSTTAITATVPANSKLYLKATTDAWGDSSSRNKIFCDDIYNVGGNIMSLLYGDNFIGITEFPTDSTYNFNGLFQNDTNIVNAENLILPATTLTNSCYRSMFSGTSITQAPALPATTLVNNCYQYMFRNCTSLTTAPELPATRLAIRCYLSMFSGCTSLTKVITYASRISAGNCLDHWLQNVSATGDFYNLGGATYESGENGIPTGWTEHTSL